MNFIWSRRSRVATVVVLASVCALSNMRMARRAFEAHRRWSANPYGRYLARVELLRTRLTAAMPGQLPVRMGYLAQPEQFAADSIHPDNRFYLTRYAMAPSLVERRGTNPLVIFDSDDPDAVPPEAIQRNWSLLAEVAGGLKLYRTSARECP